MPGIRSVEFRSLRDPALNLLDEVGRQRIILLRHALIFIRGGDEFEQMTFGEQSIGDRRLAAFTGLSQPLEGIQPVTTLLLLGSMTRHAFLLQDGRNLFGKADRRKGPGFWRGEE